MRVRWRSTLLCMCAGVCWAGRPSSVAAQPATVEVTVHGESSDAPGTPRPRESRLVPGAFGDPLRAVETLPGVAPTASGLPYFYIRGAPPANSGYFVDGIPVPLLFHIGPGPSVLAPGLVDHVDFFPGSPPARYGGYLGGIIAAETAQPSPARRVEYGVRTFDANALVEAPLGRKTTALASGRYGYPNVLLGAIGSTVSVDYFDYALRISHELGARDTLTFFAFGADDTLHDETRNRDLFAASFHRFDLRYDRRLDQGSLRAAATLGLDRTGRGAPGQPVNDEVASLGPRFRLEWQKRASSAVSVSTGLSASGLLAHYEAATSTGAQTRVAPHSDATLAEFVDLALRPVPRLEISPGIRLEVYKSGETMLGAVDPRLAVGYDVTDALRWVAAGSIAQQPPTYLVPAPGVDFDVRAGLQTAAQVSVGSELSLGSRLFVSVTGFYSAIDDATDYVSSCGRRQACSIVERVSGESYGVELLLKRPLSNRLSGWIAYTLGRAERTFEGERYLSPFDRTQAFSGVGSYNFGSGYRAGLRATYYSGRPEFPALGEAFTFRPGEASQRRLPDFYRVDARAEKTWFLGKSGAWLRLVLELFNATFTKEAYDWTCDGSGRCSARMVGPIALPSIGVEGAL